MSSATPFVTIVLHRASHLLAKDLNGYSDPYVLFTIAGQTQKSQIIKKTLFPDYQNETFQFVVQNMIPTQYHNATMLVEVYDYDLVTSDDFIGKCTIPLYKLPRDYNEPVQELLNSQRSMIYMTITAHHFGRPKYLREYDAIVVVIGNAASNCELLMKRVRETCDKLRSADDSMEFALQQAGQSFWFQHVASSDKQIGDVLEYANLVLLCTSIKDHTANKNTLDGYLKKVRVHTHAPVYIVTTNCAEKDSGANTCGDSFAKEQKLKHLNDTNVSQLVQDVFKFK